MVRGESWPCKRASRRSSRHANVGQASVYARPLSLQLVSLLERGALPESLGKQTR